MTSLPSRLGKAAAPALGLLSDLVMPPVCVIPECTRRKWKGLPLCTACLRKFHFSSPGDCPACGLPECSQSHSPEEKHFSGIRSLLRLTREVSILIHGLKYGGMKRNGRFLSQFLRYRQDLIGYVKGFDALVPVPLHHLKKRERGYNQSLIIADALSVVCGVPSDDTLLKRTRYTRTQTKLTAEQRSRNIRGAFIIKKADGIAGKKFLLVDDVFTTGFTADECASVLKKSGAAEAGVFALAHAGITPEIGDFELEMQMAGMFLC